MITIINVDSARGVGTLHSPLRTDMGSGRTRTDEYEFTKLALWLLKAQGP